MGLFDFFDEQQVERTFNADPSNPEHQSHLSHELIAGAAAFAAARAYQSHTAQNGRPVDHAAAKSLIAAFAGAEADKLAETKGLNFIDRERAKHSAERQAEEALAQSGQY